MQISLDLIRNLEGHSGAGRGLKKAQTRKENCSVRMETGKLQSRRNLGVGEAYVL